jgi:hypothetical protein
VGDDIVSSNVVGAPVGASNSSITTWGAVGEDVGGGFGFVYIVGSTVAPSKKSNVLGVLVGAS